MSIDAKMLVENAALKEQVSNLIAARESLVVLNASLAEKNEILAAKLQKLVDTVKPRWNVYEKTWDETVAQRTERERLEKEQEDASALLGDFDDCEAVVDGVFVGGGGLFGTHS